MQPRTFVIVNYVTMYEHNSLFVVWKLKEESAFFY